MAVTKVTYATTAAITIDVSSLASDDTFLAGVESAQQDNTSNLYVDVLVQGTVTGHATTAPAVGDEVRVYVWGSDTSLGTTALNTLDGTSSGETLGHAAVRNALRLAAVCQATVATAALVYYVLPFSVAQLFGGMVPKYWGLFVVHNLGDTLAASQSNSFSMTGITYTTA